MIYMAIAFIWLGFYLAHRTMQQEARRETLVGRGRVGPKEATCPLRTHEGCRP